MPNDEELVDDIEEFDEETKEEAPLDAKLWEMLNREVFITEIDYTLGQLAQMVEDGEIDLKPEYQRRHRWNIRKKSALIESFIMNVPVPPIYLNEDELGEYSVIDGKQRLLAISEFISGQLELSGLTIFSELNNKSFDELAPKYKRVIKSRQKLKAILILRQTDPDVKFETFMRLNTGGVPLNAQEIRNAAFTGPFNDMLLEVSQVPQFHALLGIEEREKSRMWVQMRDVEFVLRYLTFRDDISSFTSRQRNQMTEYMAANRHMDEEQLKATREDFLATLGSVEACFGVHAFRRWNPQKGEWIDRILAALYDAQMFSCMEISSDSARPKQEQILEEMKKLFENEDFQQYISVSTNTPTHFNGRIQMVRKMLHDVVGE